MSHPPSPSELCGSGTLTQAGDVGTATRGRHDALGGTAGDVVVNLSAWRGDRGKGQKQLQEFLLQSEITARKQNGQAHFVLPKPH